MGEHRTAAAIIGCDSVVLDGRDRSDFEVRGPDESRVVPVLPLKPS